MCGPAQGRCDGVGTRETERGPGQGLHRITEGRQNVRRVRIRDHHVEAEVARFAHLDRSWACHEGLTGQIRHRSCGRIRRDVRARVGYELHVAHDGTDHIAGIIILGHHHSHHPVARRAQGEVHQTGHRVEGDAGNGLCRGEGWRVGDRGAVDHPRADERVGEGIGFRVDRTVAVGDGIAQAHIGDRCVREHRRIVALCIGAVQYALDVHMPCTRIRQVHDGVVPVDVRPADLPAVTGRQGDRARIGVLFDARKNAPVAGAVGQFDIAQLGEFSGTVMRHGHVLIAAWAGEFEVVARIHVDPGTIPIHDQPDAVLVRTDALPIDLATAHVRGPRGARKHEE